MGDESAFCIPLLQAYLHLDALHHSDPIITDSSPCDPSFWFLVSRYLRDSLNS